MIDLRSDTVTKPSPAMLKAMANAELGDDDREGDPTVRRLQELAAEKLAKEAALFVPSGTMGNLLAYMAHCTHGAEVIISEKAHTFTSESTNAAAIHGVSMRQIPVEGPYLDPKRVEAAIRRQRVSFLDECERPGVEQRRGYDIGPVDGFGAHREQATPNCRFHAQRDGLLLKDRATVATDGGSDDGVSHCRGTCAPHGSLSRSGANIAGIWWGIYNEFASVHT